MRNARNILWAFALFAAALLAPPASPSRRTPVVEVVEKTRDVVVNISTQRIVLQREEPRFRSTHPFDQLWEDFFQPRRYRRAEVLQPLGSGIVLDEEGLVLTNAHVIRRASNLRLLLADGREHEGELLAADVNADLALLRILDLDGPLRAPPMCMDEPILGETVIALGNPFGLSNSVTTGVVSSIDRDLDWGEGDLAMRFEGLIQTSALINPGNSGGPLLNLQGELMGINTAIVPQAQGIGFAIPTRQIRKVLARLLSTPDVRPAFLGLALNDCGPPVVAEVAPDGPAHRAGLRAGDAIEALDGRRVLDAFDFAMALLRREPGQRLRVRYRRGGEPLEAEVVLAAPPPPPELAEIAGRLGVGVQDVDRRLAESMNLPIAWGVLVTEVEPDGPGARAGLAEGDVLVQLGRYRVQSVAQAAQALREINPGDRVNLSVIRGGRLGYTSARTR